MVEGRSKAGVQDVARRPAQGVARRVEVVAMDGFTGFKTATTEELPDAVTVMDPFHVVRLAGDALDECRRRVQQDLHGHRGRKPVTRSTGPAHPAHRRDLLTDSTGPAGPPCSPATSTSRSRRPGRIYQRHDRRLPHEPDRATGRSSWSRLIDRVSTGVPAALVELVTLGRTLKSGPPTCWPTSTAPARQQRPTEAINGRLEHLRGSALGFRNLTNYIARASSKPADSDPNSYTLDWDGVARQGG
jgi:transposase